MPTETIATTGQSDLPSGCAGCLQYAIVMSAGIFLIIGIMWAAPDSPTPPSNAFGSYGIMVSEQQNTCFEVDVVYCEKCTPHPGHVMKLYYTQLGGWFQSAKRVLLYTQEEYNDSDGVQFARVNNTPSLPIKVWIPNNVWGKEGGSFIFKPPVTYEQAQLMKPVTQLTKPTTR
jgi:hypothetical protein